MNAVLRAAVNRRTRFTEATRAARRALVDEAARGGPGALDRQQKMTLLADSESLFQLHQRIWTSPDSHDDWYGVAAGQTDAQTTIPEILDGPRGSLLAALRSAFAAAAQLKALGDRSPSTTPAQAGRLASPLPTHLAPSKITDASLKALDFDTYNAIHFKPDHGLWADESRLFQVFFHPGYLFESPVQMYEEVVDGQAQQPRLRPGHVRLRQERRRRPQTARDLGFAGFSCSSTPTRSATFRRLPRRQLFPRGRRRDAVWPLGPRAGGRHRPAARRGVSAVHPFLVRATGQGFRPAHRPCADGFAQRGGAYRFVIAPGAVQVMDVDAALLSAQGHRAARRGTAHQHVPDRRERPPQGHDWRPEIHDSDGPAMLSGSGEWIWRPLNPEHLRFNSYADQSPRGFGLMQRDRNFENYQDDGVFYERRLSLWVEPGRLGQGAVQLMELPTEDETFDNIVAFWNPAEPARPGEERLFSYRLHWGAHAPVEPAAARVIATRTGLRRRRWPAAKVFLLALRHRLRRRRLARCSGATSRSNR